jgi:hypothetical protein
MHSQREGALKTQRIKSSFSRDAKNRLTSSSSATAQGTASGSFEKHTSYVRVAPITCSKWWPERRPESHLNAIDQCQRTRKLGYVTKRRGLYVQPNCNHDRRRRPFNVNIGAHWSESSGSGRTTQAQRRRPRDAPMATATARRRSLQRMVRPRHTKIVLVEKHRAV